MIKNVQTKISAALKGAMFLLVSLILICSIYSMISFQMIGKNLTTFYNVEYNTTKDQMEIRKDVQTIIKRVLWAVICMDPSVTEEQRAELDGRFTKMEQYIATIETNLSDAALGSSMNSALRNFEDSTYKMLDMVAAGDHEGAVAYYETDFFDISEVLADTLGNAGSQSDAAAQTKYEKNIVIQSTATVILIIISACSLLFALILVKHLTKRIVNPVEDCARRIHLLVKNGDLHTEVPAPSYQDETGMMLQDMGSAIKYLYQIVKLTSDHLDAIAKGDLNRSVDFNFDGDFAPLGDSLGVIYDSLNDTMRQINQSANQVSAGSEQVAAGAQALSQGATEQAASVEELAATIGKISGNISENASYAKSASQKAASVKEIAGKSSSSMQDMLSAMADISNSSGEIGHIIKTIEDIAFQTNILALNAAVEAARAGTAGKGFAVVADEVRNLAGKSAEASQNTADLIEGSLHAVTKGMDIAVETAQEMNGLAEGVQDVAKIIDQISAASEMQANTMNQVTQGIDEIAGVVQTNSATAEEDAATSTEMSSQAKILKDLVGRFSLKR